MNVIPIYFAVGAATTIINESGLAVGPPLTRLRRIEFRRRQIQRVRAGINRHRPCAAGRFNRLHYLEFAGRRFFHNRDRPIAATGECITRSRVKPAGVVPLSDW